MEKFIPTKKNILIAASIVILFFVGLYFLFSFGKVSTDNARVKMGDVQIVAEAQGYVAKILAQDNQLVQGDEILLIIDDSEYKIKYGHAKAAYDKAHSDYQFLQKEYQRKKMLLKGGFISESDLSRAESEFKAAESSLNLFENEVNLAKYHLDRTEIKSSNSGVVSNLDLKIGDFVAAGRPLFHVVDKNDVWIEANFKEVDLKNVKAGQKAEIIIDSFGNQKWSAIVASIAPATGAEFSLLPAQNSSGNWIKVVQRISVRLKFDDGQDLSKLASGMSAKVIINTRT